MVLGVALLFVAFVVLAGGVAVYLGNGTESGSDRGPPPVTSLR
jgi:hypothetical protein